MGIATKEDWWVELRYADKAWHSFQDAHAGYGGSHTLDYCLNFVKKKREVFFNGTKNGISYRLHDHVKGDVIPLEALGI